MLRANGDSSSEIIYLISTEGLALGVLGAILGVALTVVIWSIFQSGVPMPPTPGTDRELPVILDMQPAFAITAMLFAIATTLAATFGASLQILKLPITQALRSH